ncbi:MAG: GGDEF domain-containing protein [Cycloclasticus sp.]
MLSSRLYPEWPFAKLPHVPEAIAEQVVATLLLMPATSEAAMSANIMGWTIPQNYREVDLAYSQLALGAYKNLVNYSFVDVIKRYWKYVLLTFFFITTLVATVIYILTLNKNLKQAHEELETLANTDGLTGLPNRIFFMRLAENYLQIAKREKCGAAIMFLDLDRFKPINDTYGHDVGDAILIAVAKRIQETLRPSDIVARIGGDEFLVMLWDIDSVKNLEMVTNKLIQITSAPIITSKGDQVNVGCSVGISLFKDGKDSLKDLIKKADLALYQVKEQGRGFFAIHQD